MPKPFLPLMDGEDTLLQSTLRRVSKLSEVNRPVIVCGAAHETVVREQTTPGIALLLEPEGRGTAPALCAAALLVGRQAGPDAVLLALPSDHAIADEQAFATTVASGAELADARYLVTFAVKPREPATAYGYLRIGEAIDRAKHQFEVEAFVEKPDRQRARQFLSSGGYAWNSGIFMFRAATLIDAFEKLQPDILAACRKALPDGEGKAIALDPAAFAASPSTSIDYAIMEKARNTAAVIADFGWSDVGDWNSVWLEAAKDGQGVAVRGNALAIGCEGSLLRSEGPLIIALGLEDMIVVTTRDAVLVAPRSRAQEVKRAVDELEARRRSASATL